MFIKLAEFILSPRSVAYAFFYPCFVLVISTLSTVVEVPDFVYPECIAEIYAKYVWFHLTVKLLVFVVCTQYTLTAGQIYRIVPACLRLTTNLAFTCVGKFLIDCLSVVFGACSAHEFESAYKCVENGHTWTPRSLPLSCFLTFYGMLVLLEEAKLYERWKKIENLVRRKYELDILHCGSIRMCDGSKDFVDVEKVITLYRKSSAIVKITYCVLAIIMVLLHIANITIMLYLSTPPMVVVATLVAVLLWLITYRCIYRAEFCSFKSSVHCAKIEEYIAVSERDSEKNNVIEEIVAGNDVRTNESPMTRLLSRFYKKHSYQSL